MEGRGEGEKKGVEGSRLAFTGPDFERFPIRKVRSKCVIRGANFLHMIAPLHPSKLSHGQIFSGVLDRVQKIHLSFHVVILSFPPRFPRKIAPFFSSLFHVNLSAFFAHRESPSSTRDSFFLSLFLLVEGVDRDREVIVERKIPFSSIFHDPKDTERDNNGI